MNRQPTIQRKGQTMVEFALVIPLIIVGVFAVIVFGHLLVTYVLTGTASREGARYGSAVGAGNGGVPRYMDCQGMRDAALRAIRIAGVPESDISITIGYDHGAPPSIATCPPPPDTVYLGDRVTVQVDVAYHTIVPIPFINIQEAWPITSNTGRSIIKDVAVGPAVPPPPPDVPSVYFTSGGQTVTEMDPGDPPVDVWVTLHLSEPTDKEVTVNFNYGGTADEGGDYTLITPAPAIIPAGEVTTDIHLTITNDDVFEVEEYLNIEMSGAVNATISNPHEHAITIVDDDEPPVVSFVVADSQKQENEVAALSVFLDHASGSDVYVSLEVDSASTATVGADYDVPPTTVYIAAGTTTVDVPITIVDDEIYENTENIIFHLTNPVNAGLGPITTHTLNIIDNDIPPVLSFDSPGQNVSEQTGTVTVGLHLNTASGVAVTAPFIIDPTSTATLGEDYIIQTVSPVEIAAGGLEASIVLTILDDGDDTEGSETIIFNLGTPTNATLGSPVVHIVNIEVLTVSFNTYGQLGQEDVVQMFANMVLSKPATEDVIVPFTVSGTATDGEDFYIDPTTLSPIVIPAGQLNASIIIDVIDDTLDENDESVILTMGDPINAAPGQITEHTAMIHSNDNQPVISFQSGGQTRVEGSGLVNVILTLTPASGRDVWVSFMTTGSSANPGSDVNIITANPIVIPAGATTAMIQVDILEDTIFEGDEVLKLTLTNPVYAGIVEPSVHNILIQDNDSPVCDINGLELDIESVNTGNPKYYRVTWTRIQNNSPYNLTLAEAALAWPTGGGNNDPKLITAQWDLAKATGPYDWTGTVALSPYNITSWLSLDSDRTILTGDLRDWFMTFDLSRPLLAGNYTVTLVFRLTDFGITCQPISRTTYWSP